MTIKKVTGSLALFAGAMMCIPGCSSNKEPAEQEAPQDQPIPRFPKEGLPQGNVGGDGPVRTGEDASSTRTGTGQNPQPDPQPEGNGTPTNRENKTTSTTPGPTTSSTTSDSSGPPLKPGEARMVDWGLIKLMIYDDGTIYELERRETPAKEYQLTRLGNRRVINHSPGAHGNVLRRTFSVFDVSQIKHATKARLELFVFAPANANMRTGLINSLDPEETIELRSIDRYTAEELMALKFAKRPEAQHPLYLDVLADLADGDVYASKIIRKDMVAQDKISPAPFAIPEHSDCSNIRTRACGRWITFELSEAAVQAINKSERYWSAGWQMSSVDHNEDVTSERETIEEFAFFGGHFDLSSQKGAVYPSHLRPKIRLIAETGDSNQNPNSSSSQPGSSATTTQP